MLQWWRGLARTGTDCGALYDCYGGCTSDPTCSEADAGECSCMSACDGMHPQGLTAIHAWEQCLVSGCEAACTIGG